MTKNYIQKGLHLAGNLIKEKKYERAIQVLNNIALEDSSYTAYLELGKIYSKLNDYENAKKYLSKVMLLPGYNALIAKLELGKLERNFKNYNAAKAIFNYLMKTCIKNIAVMEMGRLYLAAGNLEEAEKQFKSLLHESNRNDARIELAKIYTSVKDYDNARKYYNLVYGSKIENEAVLGLGKLEMQLGNYDKAKEYFEKLLLTKNHITTVNYLITLGIKSNDLELAMFHFKKMLAEGFSIKTDVMVYISKLFYVGNVTNDKTLKYSEWQLLDYDPYLACEYINDKNGKYFDDSIDITKLFIDIQNYLTDEYKEGTDNLYDIYLISYENCGKNDENYIKVATIPNTKNIISMFPYKQKVLKR